MRSGLRCVKGCAAMAAPLHVAIAAAAPDRSDFPAGIGVVVAVRAACGRHDHPAALRVHEVAHKVVRKLVARFGHADVLTRTTDRLSAKLIQPCLAGLANGLRRLHIPHRRGH
jgi:hypothetical protein